MTASGSCVREASPQPRWTWRTTPQQGRQCSYGFVVDAENGRTACRDAVALRARNRLAIVENGGASLAILPPSHKFFFAREIELNLGYVYYRKDGENSFAVGVRQGDREEEYRASGTSDDIWRRRSGHPTRAASGSIAS